MLLYQLALYISLAQYILRVTILYRACGDLMEYSLLEIESHMKEGVFCMLSPAELSKLVMAVFEESPSRTSLLAAIHSQSRH